MLQVARLAPNVLGEAAELVLEFLRSQQNADGGFKDRGGNSDLYYTIFGIEGLVALRSRRMSRPRVGKPAGSSSERCQPRRNPGTDRIAPRSRRGVRRDAQRAI